MSDDEQETPIPVLSGEWLVEVLAEAPPGPQAHLARRDDLAGLKVESQEAVYRIPAPTFLELHCPKCAVPRPFDGWPAITTTSLHDQYRTQVSETNSQKLTLGVSTGNWVASWLRYRCRLCRAQMKHFFLLCRGTQQDSPDRPPLQYEIVKVGEHPRYGDRASPEFYEFLGTTDLGSLYNNASQCENHQLGVGAYAYYRRLVQGLCDKLIEDIAQVCADQPDWSEDELNRLRKLKSSWQFSRTFSDSELKFNLPDSLLIEGENPFLALHKLLSRGIHDLSDEECLRHGREVRIVLRELAKNLRKAREDNEELRSAMKLVRKEASADRRD